ncbi:MAG: MFS transporter [Clostridium sp.]
MVKSTATKAGAFLLGCFCLVAAVLLRWYFPLSPIMGETVAYPSFMTTDEGGNTYLIDDSKCEILKIGIDGKVQYRLSSDAHGKGQFSQAEEAVADAEGNLYVRTMDWDTDGLQIMKEQILRYDKYGIYDKTIYQQDYTEGSERIGKYRIFALTPTRRGIQFITIETQGYQLHFSDGETMGSEVYAWEHSGDIQNFSIGRDGNSVYAVDKRGDIYHCTKSGNQLIYAPPGASYQLPYYLTSGYDETLYAADIANESILAFRDGKKEKEYVIGDLFGEYAGVELSDAILLSINLSGRAEAQQLSVVYDQSVGLFTINAGGKIESGVATERYTYGGLPIVVKLLQMVLFVTGLVILICFAVFGLNWLIKKRYFAKWHLLLVTIACIIATAVVVVPNVLREFRKIYIEAQVEQMQMAAQIAVSNIDINDLNGVVYPGDYGSDAYKNLQSFMTGVIDKHYDYSNKMYCNLIKYENERSYAISYLDQSIGAYYPLDQYEKSELEEVYSTGNSYINKGKDDSSGSYIYVKSPVKDVAGNVCGAIEIGMVLYSLNDKISRIFLDIIIKVALLVIVAVFLVNEASGFFAGRKKHREEPGLPMSYVRLGVLFCYTAFNMPSSFLPVFMESLYDGSLPFDRALVGSLPLTVNFFLMGAAALVAAPLLRRLTFRYTMALGAGFSFAGDLMMALSGDYCIAFFGLACNGIGTGLVVSILSASVAATDTKTQQEGFSIMNSSSLSGIICGMVIGGTVAERFGQSRVFFFSSALWAGIIILFLVIGKRFRSGACSEKAKGKSAITFLSAPKPMVYLLLIQMPYIVLNGFISYFVPVFANSGGMTESRISLLLVLNSLTGVFLSMAITDRLYGKYGKRTLYLSEILSLFAILLFTLHPTIPMLVLTVFLLGISNSFGTPVRNLYFCRHKEVQEYGEDRAMGIYNFSDNLADSAGSSIFAAIANTGILTGTIILTGLSVGAMVIYSFITGKDRDGMNTTINHEAGGRINDER